MLANVAMCEGLLLLVLVMVLVLGELLGLGVVVVDNLLLLIWVGLICKVVSWELRVLTKI